MKLKRTKVVLLIVLFTLITITFISAQKQQNNNGFQHAIDDFVDDKKLASATSSITILNLSTGKIEAEFNADKVLTPASVQKIFTTAALLNLAGEEFTYRTPFYLKGMKLNDTLFMGDLIIDPVADPSFCSPYQKNAMDINALADTITNLFLSKGIKALFGNIVVNKKFIKDNPESTEWLYYDLGNYYGAGVHHLNVFENTAWLNFKAADTVPAICPILKVIPQELSSQYMSEVQSVHHEVKNDLFVLGSSESCIYKVQGEMMCCAGDTIGIKAAIKDPEALFANLFKQKLTERGIWINSQKNDLQKFEDDLLFEYESPSLKTLCERALKKSVNLYCESFVHTYAWLNSGNTERNIGLSNIKDFWKNKLDESQGFYMVDGSGLSPKNMLSSHQLVNALYWINNNKRLNKYYELLIDPDEEGMLSGALKKHKHPKNKLRLKSGSMEHVRSFAGYILESGKPKYAVAILINHYDCPGEIIKVKMAKFFAEISKS